MSLYHEAAQILTSASNGKGSLKTLAFSQKNLKADRKTLFALTTEAAKWSEVLSEIIVASRVLQVEKQLTPTLALLLAHDLLLSRRGVALPASHGLHATVARHKARLTAELTKARIRRGCMTIDALREQINHHTRDGIDGKESAMHYHPRWVRINTILTTLDDQLGTTFSEYERAANLRFLATAGPQEKLIYLDENIPDLVAVQASIDLTKTVAYREGKLILQDKASCFPAYLLAPGVAPGDIIDACAAPGNKTTHLAALLSGAERGQESRQHRAHITACERDAGRSKTLSGMVKLAGAEKLVTVRSSQDFMRLQPHRKEFANVTCLLLDPSCSGSGIVGRDEQTITIHLPDPSEQPATTSQSKKRKRSAPKPQIKVDGSAIAGEDDAAENIPETEDDAQKLQTRLTSLSGFQLRLLEHAMAFPAARRIAYSTCSIHDAENEHVVVKALLSDVAKERGWRIMKRDEQVDGLRKWQRRGRVEAMTDLALEVAWQKSQEEMEEAADACIRCTKDSEDGMMGFFVAGFVRDVKPQPVLHGHDTAVNRNNESGVGDSDDNDGDEWNGFDDEVGP